MAASLPAERVRPDRRALWGQGALLVALTAVAYWRVAGAGAIWDDDAYLTENPVLSRPDALVAIFFEQQATPQYYPLVFSSFWLEKQLWGLELTGYHLVNVALHAVAALFAWRALDRVMGRGAYLAALLFALHPVHVESVAWISERKNVLSGALYLAAALALLPVYLDDALPRKSADRRTLAGLGLYVLALLAKTVTVTLPAALLVAQWAHKGRVSARGAVTSAILVVPGLALADLTVWYESHVVGAPEGLIEGPLEHLAVAGTAPWFYLGKLLWPADLAFIYPRWDLDEGAWRLLYPALTALVLAVAFAARRRVGRAPLAGLLFFGGTLFPALGFVSVYPMRFSFVADHFQYLASLGPLALVGLGFARLSQRWSKPALGGAALVVVVLGGLTMARTAAFVDEETLWRETLKVNPDCALCWTNLGSIHKDREEQQLAVEAWRRAAQLDPTLGEPRYNLGVYLVGRAGPQAALPWLEQAYEALPLSTTAARDLAKLYAQLGRWADAERVLVERLEVRGPHAELQIWLGRVRRAAAKAQRARPSAGDDGGAGLSAPGAPR